MESNPKSSNDDASEVRPSDQQLTEASGGFALFGGVVAVEGAAIVNGADQAKLHASTGANLERLHEAQRLRERAQAKKEYHAQQAINAQKEDKLIDDLGGLDVSKLQDFENSTNS